MAKVKVKLWICKNNCDIFYAALTFLMEMVMLRVSGCVLALCGALALTGCASNGGPQQIGPNKYVVSQTSYTAWSGADEQAKAIQKAQQFCAAKGQEANILAMSSTDAVAYKSVASGSVTFECVNPNRDEVEPVELADGQYVLAGSTSGYQGIKARYALLKQASKFCAQQGKKVQLVSNTREAGTNYTSVTGNASVNESAESSTQNTSADIIFRCVRQ